MTIKSIFYKGSVFVLSAICALVLAGCGSEYGYTGGTAATVNGTAIDEDTVTKYIQDFRTSAELTSEEDWANWLIESSQDASSVREQVIDYYVQQELVRQAAAENEVTVDEDAVNEELESMKSNYSSDAAWQEALSESGITEDQYRESIELGLLSQALEEKVITEEDSVDEAGLLEMLNTYKDMINGSKRSSHILFSADDQETAQSVCDQLQAGTIDFETAAKQYSTDSASAEKGGDVGWDQLNSFVDEYTDALSQIDKGQITMTTSDYGIHIILCTDVLELPDNPTLSDYPDEFVSYMSTIYTQQKQSDDYQQWLSDYQDNAEIVINDMPSNVPYNVDLTLYQSDDSEDSDEEGETSDETSEDATDETTEDSGTQETSVADELSAVEAGTTSEE